MVITSMQKERTQTSQFPAVLHTASLALFSEQYLRWTSKICKYVEQMVSTDIPIQKTNLIGSREWIRKQLSEIIFGRCCRIFKKPVYITKLFAEEQFELQNSDFSSKVFLHTKTKSRKQLNTTRKTQSKRYTENTSLSNIYQRFY